MEPGSQFEHQADVRHAFERAQREVIDRVSAATVAAGRPDASFAQVVRGIRASRIMSRFQRSLEASSEESDAIVRRRRNVFSERFAQACADEIADPLSHHDATSLSRAVGEIRRRCMSGAVIELPSGLPPRIQAVVDEFASTTGATYQGHYQSALDALEELDQVGQVEAHLVAGPERIQ